MRKIEGVTNVEGKRGVIEGMPSDIQRGIFENESSEF